MRRMIGIVGALAIAACGGSAETELFESDGPGDRDSSGALSPDADSGSEDGATGDGSTGERVCAPGKVEACACPGGGQGAQACRQDGAGWEACECAAGDGGAGDGGGGGVNNGGDPDPLPYDCETTFACGCKADIGDTWCVNDPGNNPAYANLYHGCTGRPKHCKAVTGQDGWWCCKY